MKNMSKVVSFIIVVIVFVFILSSCETSEKWVLNLITKNEITEEIEYVSIYSNGKSEKIDKFISDDIEIYNADSDCFISYISKNKVLNKLNKIVLKDSDGNTVDNDEIITDVFQSAEKIKHDIWKFKIIKIDDDYFAVVKLNVNWESPCDFYEYDKTEKKLKFLHSFDSVDIIGLSLTRKE